MTVGILEIICADHTLKWAALFGFVIEIRRSTISQVGVVSNFKTASLGGVIGAPLAFFGSLTRLGRPSSCWLQALNSWRHLHFGDTSRLRMAERVVIWVFSGPVRP